MNTHETFLYSARLASKMGSHAVACELYEHFLTWKDGDPLLDLKSKFGNQLIESLKEKITQYASEKRKVEAIKTTREDTGLGLKDAKELVELLAVRMNLSFN